MAQAITIAYQIALSDVSDKKANYKITATDEEKQLLCDRFSLLAIDSLEGSMSVLHRSGDDAIVVKGSLQAAVTQRCVVTLAPVNETVETDFEVLMVSADKANAWDEEEKYLDDDFPEYDAIEDNILYLGDIFAQTLSINLDPYPKAENAELQGLGPNVTANEAELERPNPFSVLSKLQDKT